MTSVPEESTASSECERLFAAFLEQYHEHGTDPEVLFAAHPEHERTLRRWWRRLAAVGEIEAAPSGERFGRFILLREVGAGAQGCVHLALDTQLNRRVALKTLPLHRAVHSAAVDRFRREAAMASKLEHPGICTVYEAGEHDGIAYIAMQFVDGETLAARLTAARDREGQLSVEAVLELGQALAMALHTAHGAGLVHRDVKPGNIMVAADDQPVILDFGLASDTNSISDLTRTGDVLGTPSYMSPEQLHGGCGTLDPRTDVYSLGVVLYECFTLHRPFEGPTQESLQQQILTAQPPDPRQWQPLLSREAVLVLNTALAKDRTHRYATARDFAEDLRRLSRHEAVLARPVGPLLRVWRWSQLRPALAISVAAILITTLTATIIISLLYIQAESERSKYGQLADIELLRLAEDDAAELQPATPELAPALATWLTDKGGPLAQRLQLHREALAELRHNATWHPVRGDRDLDRHPDMPRLLELRRLYSDYTIRTENTKNPITRAATAARATNIEGRIASLEARLADHRIYVLADRDAALRHTMLEDHVRDLEQFVGKDGLLTEMKRRLYWAQNVVRLTVEEHQEKWQEVIAAIAGDERYRSQTLAPQVGLVPLGPDPASGLQEFAFVGGGSTPTRDTTTQKLQFDATTAPVLVLVPPQRFLRGASKQPGLGHDPWAEPDEGPPAFIDLHWYLIGKNELTRGQWRRLAYDHRRDPQFLTTDDLGSDADLHPVTDVDWFRCTEVLARHQLLLPSEAQWECATRGGSTTSFWFGPHSLSKPGAANLRVRGRGDNVAATGGHPFTAPAYSMLANDFGLHHTAGNVAEWCRESFLRSAYKACEVNPGDGLLLTQNLNLRSLRGGSFAVYAPTGRSASRGGRPGNARNNGIGLRIARRVID